MNLVDYQICNYELDTITIKIIKLTISLILTSQRKPQLPPLSSVLPNDTLVHVAFLNNHISLIF